MEGHWLGEASHGHSGGGESRVRRSSTSVKLFYAIDVEVRFLAIRQWRSFRPFSRGATRARTLGNGSGERNVMLQLPTSCQSVARPKAVFFVIRTHNNTTLSMYQRAMDNHNIPPHR